MELEIHDTDVTRSDVPASPADVDELDRFALSFDGYAHWGDRCGALAESARAAFRADGTLPDSLDDLRACLFYEQQRWRWSSRSPDADSTAYLQGLLDAIRAAAPD